jgi:tetratricopeptide (TPR) repeat protein
MLIHYRTLTQVTRWRIAKNEAGKTLRVVVVGEQIVQNKWPVSAANLKSSIDAAARHLFRNLTRPQALERNPIVCRFFGEGSSKRGSPSNEQKVLELIHRLIIQAAENCKRADIEVRKHETACRQYTIVTKCCLEGRSLSYVAAELGISIRQCYRERAIIYRRIAAYVSNYSGVPDARVSSFLNPFRFQMDRAAALAEGANLDAALRVYDRVADFDVSASHKLEALCKRADLLLDLGDFKSSERSLQDARRLLTTCGGDGPARRAIDATRLHLEWIQGKLAWTTGRFTKASAAFDRACMLIDGTEKSAGKRVKELCIQVLVESAEHLMYQGRFKDAAVDFEKAGVILRSVFLPSPLRRHDVLYGVANLNDVANGSDTWPLTRRIVVLQELSDLASQSGSIWRAVRTLANLAAHYGFLRDFGSAEDAATSALSLAKVHPTRQVKLTILDLAEALLVATPYWDRVPSILHLAEVAITEKTIHWTYCQLLWSFYFLRTRQYVRALTYADAAHEAAVTAQTPRLEGAAQRNRAIAAHFLGQEDGARDSLARALSIVTRHGSILSCLETYRAAAKITGNKQFQLRANKLRRLLTA